MICTINRTQGTLRRIGVLSILLLAAAPAFGQSDASEKVRFVKFLTKAKSQPIAGLLGRENETHIEVFALGDGQGSILKKDDLRQVQKDISENELIATVGLPSFLAWKIHRTLPVASAGRIVKVDATATYVSLGTKAGVKVGDELRVYRGMTELKDPVTGEVLGTERRLVAKLLVFESRETFAKAKLQGELEIALEIGDSVEPSNFNNSLVIFPFTDEDGNETSLGRELSESLTTNLVKRRVNVIERMTLGKVLGELLIQQTILFDPATAQRVGKQVGGHAALLGSLAQAGVSSDVQIRLVEIETGRILFATNHRVFGKSVGDPIKSHAVTPALPPDTSAATPEISARFGFDGSARPAAGASLSVKEVGKLAFDSGKRGKSLKCGTGTFITLPHGSKHELWNGDFTVAFWLSVTDASKDGIVMAKGQYNKPGWIIDVAANGRPGAIRMDTWCEGSSLNQETVTPSKVLKDGTWHHVCFTVKKSEGKREVTIFVDGKERARGSAGGGNLNIASMDLDIGKFNGNLDDLVILDLNVDEKQVASLMGM